MENKTKTECPSWEELSAFYDGENAAGSVRSHITACPLCQEKLNSFHEMDSKLSAELDHAVPADLEKRILLRVHNSREWKAALQPVPAPKLFLARIIHFAAVFIFISIIGLYVLNTYHKQPERTTGIPRERVMPSASKTAALSASDDSVIRISELAPVSFGGSAMPVQKKNVQYELIPDNIYQVWSIPAESYFKDKVLKQLYQCGFKSAVKDMTVSSADKITVSFFGTKKQAVQFVHLCNELGCSLLSPVQPQPEQLYFYGSADEPVHYSADFISAK